MSSMDARRIDIDLLRAVAVLSVILFHFDVPGFSGGFLGVDVFFVISGYLITSHINKQLSDGSFSFSGFYVRRIRRLMPALAATMLLTSIAAIFILPRSLLLDFAESQLASSVYLSNMYFWSVADYFDTDSYLKPLLHTWSLSVEEQFYLLWPLCLVLIGTKNYRWFIAGAGVLSLIAAEWASANYPSAAFFMFPFRIFEFAIGAGISASVYGKGKEVRRHFLLVAALLSLFGALFLLDEQDRMPGLLSLPICIATAILIYINHPLLNRRDIVSRLFLRIGLISYSAYLVHWPLVVFYKILVNEQLRWYDSAALLIGTLVLAELFYRLVEKPTAKIATLNRNKYFFGFLVVMMISSVFYLWGAPRIYDAISDNRHTVKAVLDNTPERESEIRTAIKAANLPINPQAPFQILVVGDSHSVDVVLGIASALSNENIGLQVLNDICDPLTITSISEGLDTHYENHGNKNVSVEKCTVYNTEFLQKITMAKPNLLIFSEQWREETIPYLQQTLVDIGEKVDVDVLILGRNFEFRRDPLVALIDVELPSEINAAAKNLQRDGSAIDSALKGVADDANVSFISKVEIVCPDGECDILLDDRLSYSDRSHWTWEGARLFGSRLVDHPVFQRLIDEAD